MRPPTRTAPAAVAAVLDQRALHEAVEVLALRRDGQAFHALVGHAAVRVAADLGAAHGRQVAHREGAGRQAVHLGALAGLAVELVDVGAVLVRNEHVLAVARDRAQVCHDRLQRHVRLLSDPFLDHEESPSNGPPHFLPQHDRGVDQAAQDAQRARLQDYIARNSARAAALAPLSARWRSGYAEDCKSLHAGSIPARASTDRLMISRPAPGLVSAKTPR